MKLTSRRIVRLAAVLGALAVSMAVVDSAAAGPGSVGLAQGILVTKFGFSPARAASWTTGVCSYPDRPASCYQTPSQARSDSVAEARALGVYRGLTARQTHDWSVGVCSHADKPSSCYTAAAGGISGSSGFGWGDAGIGASAALGVVLLVVGLGFTVARRRLRPLRHA